MRAAIAGLLLTGTCFVSGCSKSEIKPKGQPGDPGYVSDPDPLSFGSHYEGTPLAPRKEPAKPKAN